MLRQGKVLDKLTKQDIQLYITSLIDEVSTVTINGRFIVYKVFYRHLKDEGFVEVDPMCEIRKMKQPRLIKDVLSPDDIGKVLAQLDRKTFNGSRDFCMILLTFDAMLRLAELLAIRADALDLSTGVIKVYGKGRKERYVAFSPQTARTLHTFITRFRKGMPGPLLFSQRDGTPFKYRSAHRIFSKPAAKVGLHLLPQMARHSGATQFARSGGSLAVLQRALGHSTLAVTERYDHMGDEDVLREYEKHSPAANVRI